MLVLGIESSCDETAAAVVESGTLVRSSVVASQHDLHAEYRGVVPEIASRAHAERILPVVRESIAQAGASLDQIKLIAVANRPGLIGSLLVGVSAAKALSWSLGVPLVGVDHVQAHLHGGFLARAGADPSQSDLDQLDQTLQRQRLALQSSFPALGLVVSGGHTAIYRCESPTSLHRLGATIDDALGEAYDKVAAMLQLAHPGGPEVDRLAQQPGADERAFDLPISRISPQSLDLSFSGLKTAVLYILKGVPGEHRRDPSLAQGLDPNDQAARASLCASFQRAAIAAVKLKLERALDRHQDIRTILAGGGVVANSKLRRELTSLAHARGLALKLPAMEFCLDNAAMIAGLGHELHQAGRIDGLNLLAEPTGAR